ncbi:toxin-antitoxin system, toxin component [Streptomyces antibioticus]|uniref:Toxin-antitoxin system, toxin component n=2 Tax=Streptomyces antibioticus TaxID=1890 RepID=A0ABX3LJH0_STRAT|nr:toxin-antitoxin system, toxin component [Streptomyces antibioticus]
MTRMRNIPDRTAAWRKSTYSGGGGDDCLEVADGHAPFTPVRDSKTPLGPKLLFRAEAWSAFVEGLKKG